MKIILEKMINNHDGLYNYGIFSKRKEFGIDFLEVIQCKIMREE